jgi:hypothetical protein
MSRILKWNGNDVPEKLRSLPAGRYVVEALDETHEAKKTKASSWRADHHETGEKIWDVPRCDSLFRPFARLPVEAFH